MGVGDHLGRDDSTTSGNSSWALVERAPWAANAQSYIGTGDLYGAANAALNDPRSGTWTMPLSSSERNSDAVFGMLPVGTQKSIDRIAKLYNANSTGESLWSKAMAGSAASTEAGKPMTAFEWLSNYAAQFGADGTGAGGGGSRGGGGGGGAKYIPQHDVAYQNAQAPDVRAIADGVAQEMLGRVVTDDEMKRILKRVRKYENRNPTVRDSMGSPSGSVSRTKDGATNTGRQQIIENLIAKNPDFMPYQMDHTVYDAMLSVMKQGQEIANG